MAKFTIAGQPARFGDIWVHLKAEPRGSTHLFEMIVPCEELIVVFDPYQTKKADRTWPDHVSANLRELGGFAMQGYIESLMKLSGEVENRYVHVLAAVDSIEDQAGGVMLRGRIEEWCPSKYR